MRQGGARGAVLNSLPYFGSNGGPLALSAEAGRALGAWYEDEVRSDDVLAATVVANPLADADAYKDGESVDTHTQLAATFFRGKHVRLGADENLARMHHLVHTSEATGDRRLVLRKGSVINMTEDIPPEYIQLTRSLLLAACLLAVKQTKDGLVDIPDDVQEKLRDFIQAHLQKTFGKSDGEAFADLTRPDFRQLADWRL